MENLYVPNLTSFVNDNIYYGSCQNFRFKLSPDLSAQEIHAEYWYGPLCYEQSEMAGDRIFPLTKEGVADMAQWLLGLSDAPALAE